MRGTDDPPERDDDQDDDLRAGEEVRVISVTTLINFMAGYNARLAVVGMPTIVHDLNADIWSMTT